LILNCRIQQIIDPLKGKGISISTADFFGRIRRMFKSTITRCKND